MTSSPEPASSRLATREPATRTFAAPLALGTLSAPATAAAATAKSSGALNDVIEWSEWHRLLARHDVEGVKEKQGASRYWRWHGEHLVRYRVWGDDEDNEFKASSSASTNEEEPVLVLVHG